MYLAWKKIGLRTCVQFNRHGPARRHCPRSVWLMRIECGVVAVVRQQFHLINYLRFSFANAQFEASGLRAFCTKESRYIWSRAHHSGSRECEWLYTRRRVKARSYRVRCFRAVAIPSYITCRPGPVHPASPPPITAAFVGPIRDGMVPYRFITRALGELIDLH